MSGPKVVRIVTREEVLEICRGHLARVDAALAEWTKVGNRNDCIDEAALLAANRRRDALAAMIASDRFMDLQKQAPIEEGFLRDDMQHRLTAVAAEQAAARSRGRREREAASALLKTLRSSGNTIDEALAQGLQRGDASALSAGFQMLAAAATPASGSREAAARLRDVEPTLTLADWVARQPPALPDPATERVEARLDALAAFADEHTLANWQARIDEATTAPASRRALLLDGLEVETGRALTQARRRASARLDFDMMLAELNAAGLETQSLSADAESLGEDELSARTADAQSALEAHRASRAAEARRAAVLEGLAGLGYEVAEGMSTTWVADGRLVLRSATRPDYGVELAGGTEGGRMQMRAVAFETAGQGPDPSRDRDAETIWCGDVTGLDKRLASIGGGLVIERALAVGATPLKRIAIEASVAPGTTTAAPVLKQRTLR
jgi:hypothetical protein